MGVRVVTDSACDLPQALVDKLGIVIVPLTIRFGDEGLIDREELSTDDFWRRLQASDVLPETSAPSAGAFEATFRDLAADGADGIVCINISSKLSATMQAAQVASKAAEPSCPVSVVDSLSVSMGLGALVIAAAEQAASGATLDAILDEVASRRDRVKIFAALDTLEYVKKGGRIGGARAMLGSMLSIKPIVEIRDGVVEEAGKVRTRSKALRLLVDKVKEYPLESLAVVQGLASDLDELLDMLDPIFPRDQIVVSEIGPVVGTHAGPGVIGVAFQTARS